MRSCFYANDYMGSVAPRQTGKSEFGLCGVVGGMTVIVMLVGAWWKCCGDASGTPEMV